MLGCICPQVLQGAQEAHWFLFRGHAGGQRIQMQATWPYGSSPPPSQCEQDRQIAGGISGGGFGLPWGTVTGSTSPTILDPLPLQTLGHLEEHTRELSRLDLLGTLFPCQGTPGQHHPL